MPLFPNGSSGSSTPGSGVAGPVTFANLPSAAASANLFYWVSDLGAGGTLMRSNGTRWKVVGTSLIYSRDSASSPIANVETITDQTLFPANSLAIGDTISMRLTLTKSGTTDTGGLRIRMGTLGTTGDQLLYNQTFLAAANTTGAVNPDFTIRSATTILQGAANNLGGASWGYSIVTPTATGGATTISNVSNALWFSLSLISGGATNTLTMTMLQMYLTSTCN